MRMEDVGASATLQNVKVDASVLGVSWSGSSFVGQGNCMMGKLGRRIRMGNRPVEAGETTFAVFQNFS